MSCFWCGHEKCDCKDWIESLHKDYEGGEVIEPEVKKINPFGEPQEGGDHYRKGDTMDVAEWCERRGHSPAEFNIIKYTDRHRDKHGIEDLRKAYQYLKFLAWIEYEENL